MFRTPGFVVLMVLALVGFGSMVEGDVRGKREVEAKRLDFVEKCVADTATTNIDKYNHKLNGCTEAAEKLYPFNDRMKNVR